MPVAAGQEYLRWDTKWHDRARELCATGMTVKQVARTITQESGRYCARVTCVQWVVPREAEGGLGRHHVWEQKWKDQAAELYRQGIPLANIAAITEIEAERKCTTNHISYWLRVMKVRIPKRSVRTPPESE